MGDTEANVTITTVPLPTETEATLTIPAGETKTLGDAVKDVQDRLDEKGVILKVPKQVKDLIIENGFSRETGARSLRRQVERLIEDPLAEEMLKGTITLGSTVRAKLVKNEVVFANATSVASDETVG